MSERGREREKGPWKREAAGDEREKKGRNEKEIEDGRKINKE